jgi:Domain of unknown function (DUF4262)
MTMSSDEEIARSVAAHGWHCIGVPDASPEFSYTCGLLTTFDHPESIIFGLDSETAYTVLSAMVDAIRDGGSFATPGMYDGVLSDLPIAVRTVHPSQHELYLGYAMGHCRYTGKAGGLEAIQVFWPDKQGRFPFESECDSEVAAGQPRLEFRVSKSELRAFRKRYGN